MEKLERKYTLEDIKPFLGEDAKIIGNLENKYFTNVQSYENIYEESLDWIDHMKPNRQELFEKSKAKIIICDNSIIIHEEKLIEKCIIIVKNPKLTFARIVNNLFLKHKEYGIHQTAYIHPDAKIHQNTYIGPFSYIGKAIIGENTIIHGHCYIYDNSEIGKNVIIKSGAVIGSEGFGFVRNEKNEFEKFPHLGGVIIEDDVEIGANATIDRGSLSYTIIKQGAKIDNLVQIGHNVVIGKHAAVVANTTVGGSTKIGDFSWIAPSSTLRDHLKIGSKAILGIGSVIIRNVPDNETWIGNPAMPLKEFVLIQEKIKNL